MASPIASIVVAGDGIAAWAAAAGLARRLPGVRVTVVPTPGAAPAVTDHVATMLPSALAFHRRIGLPEQDVFDAVDGVFRLGTRYAGWNAVDHVVGHGGYGPSLPGFAQLWARAALTGAETPFAAHSPAAMLAAQGRIAMPSDDPASPFSAIDLGLAAEPETYRRYLRAYARHCGAHEAKALAQVVTGGDRITGLRLADGATLTADLYVDASGPDALLLSRLAGGNRREDWRGWLPCDRVTITDAAPDASLPPADTATAASNGWTLTSPLRTRTIVARVHEAAAVRDAPGTALRLTQGRRDAAWIGNTVAIGDAAVEIEPLAGPHIHLVHATVDRIVALLPDAGFARVEIDHYNREWAQEADHLRDYIVLHYAVSSRTEPFWRKARATPPPPELGEALALFGERGRLPQRDRESYGRNQWFALLFGSGHLPRHPDALADAMPVDAFNPTAARHRALIAAAVARAPTHADFIRTYRQGHAA